MAGDDLLDDDPQPSKSGGLRFDLTINVTLLVFLVVQLCAFVWLFSNLSTNVTALMAAQPGVTSSISTLDTTVSNLGLRTTALESRVSGDEQTVTGLSAKRDGQIAALQAENNQLGESVAATSASLAAIQANVDRILNLLQSQTAHR